MPIPILKLKNNSFPMTKINNINKAPLISTDNFDMNPVELKNYVPENEDFNIKRIYYINNVKGEKKTGQHCHIIEKEVFVIISGEATMILDEGSGLEKKTVKTNDVIWIPSFVWHGFENLSNDFVLLALSSTNYSSDRSDYIEDYSVFVEKKKEMSKNA